MYSQGLLQFLEIRRIYGSQHQMSYYISGTLMGLNFPLGHCHTACHIIPAVIYYLVDLHHYMYVFLGSRVIIH